MKIVYVESNLFFAKMELECLEYLRAKAISFNKDVTVIIRWRMC